MKGIKNLFVLCLAITASNIVMADAATEAQNSSNLSTIASGTATNGGILQQIAKSTKGILLKVNTLPEYLDVLAKTAVAWLTPDTNSATIQGDFNKYTTQSLALQTDPSLLNYIFSLGFSAQSKTALASKMAELNYTTILGSPYSEAPATAPKNSGPALRYLVNASGVGIQHISPDPTWKGFPATAYGQYYDSMNAIQSYNGYLLSKMYTENTGGTKISDIQNKLITEASSSDWFARIASEEIGVVLRQILMYNSQTYVLLSQLVQTQKELLSAQAMNNTLLILGNQYVESLLAGNASASKG